jgi:hypothetical protein
VAQIAAFQTPGDLIVVTHPAEFAFVDITHRDLVRARAHLEGKLVMANLATEPYPVKPVRKNHRPHARGLGIPVQDDIGIFATRVIDPDARNDGNGHKQGCETKH